VAEAVERENMNLVNWSNILAAHPELRVEFSILRFPHVKSEVNATVAMFELPDDLCIDVEWKSRVQHFVVTLFINPLTIDSLDNVLDERICSDPHDAVAAVQELVQRARQFSERHAYTFRSASDRCISSNPIRWSSAVDSTEQQVAGPVLTM